MVNALRVRRARPDEASSALAILEEAARWSSRFGDPIWPPGSFDLEQQLRLAQAGELVGGYEGVEMCACMWLQSQDELIWPEDVVGEALYVHKVAVSRDRAGAGWPARLLDFAEAQARECGARVIRLDTVPIPRMIALYEALGCRLVDRTARLFGDRRLVRMERPVNSPSVEPPARPQP